jgi:hypothetical protein
MSQRADYTEEEWLILWKAVTSVPTAVMVAHPDNLVPEAFAADRALDQIAKRCSGVVEQLLDPPKSEAEWLSHRLDVQRRSAGQRDADEFMNDTLDDCRQGIALLKARGTAEEVAEYQNALFQIALTVAKAGKEEGFWGIGGVRVDESEKVFLRDLAEVLGVVWNEE